MCTHVHCARSISDAWHEFRGKLYENDGNLYSATIFSNPGVRNRMGEMLGGGNIFSQQRYEGIRDNLYTVELVNICTPEGIKDKPLIAMILGIELTMIEYGRLRDSVKYTRGKFKPIWEMREKGKSIYANGWLQ